MRDAVASLLRDRLPYGSRSTLAIEHIAKEIEDAGKSEQRGLANRMAGLWVHLLKWQHQRTWRGSNWEATIRHQRQRITRRLQRTPSLTVRLVGHRVVG